MADEPPFNSLRADLRRMRSIEALCIVARNVANELRIRGDGKVGRTFEDALRQIVDEVFGDA